MSDYTRGYSDAVDQIEHASKAYLENDLGIYDEGDTLAEKLIVDIAESVTGGIVEKMGENLDIVRQESDY